MKRMRFIAPTLCALLWGVAVASDVSSKPHPGAQAAADIIRDVAGADAAFLPAGILKDPNGSSDLSALLQYPSEEIVVVKLKGSEVRESLERSIAGYPSGSGSFLQISGFTVTFSESAPPDSRILEIRDSVGPIGATREYTVAMPASLARGALGYFRIWDRSQIVKSMGTTLEQALKGKTGAANTPRYTAKP